MKKIASQQRLVFVRSSFPQSPKKLRQDEDYSDYIIR